MRSSDIKPGDRVMVRIGGGMLEAATVLDAAWSEYIDTDCIDAAADAVGALREALQ